MVRQYVGARYVPKFADPVAWTSGTSYEAMTIVTYNNSSYTSKMPIPPTVGNPADNPDYWVLTGNYNAQVEQYRQETETVSNNLTTEITNRKNADTTLQGQITTVSNNLTTEITNRKNADTTLQDQITTLQGQNTTEITNRETADATLQGNINSEASTRASADSNLQSQIDQIVAPSGEAPSAAEVQNARIGADGVTYDTLGTAIRTQVNNLNNDLDYIQNTITTTKSENTFSGKTYDDDDLTEFLEEKRLIICSIDNINKEKRINLKLAARIAESSDENTEYLIEIWKNSNGVLTIMDSIPYTLKHDNIEFDNTNGVWAKVNVLSNYIVTYNAYITIKLNGNRGRYNLIAFKETGQSFEVFDDFSSTSLELSSARKVNGYYIPMILSIQEINSNIVSKKIVVVDKSGNGDYTSVVDAVKNEPENTVIIIKPGVYVGTIEAFTTRIILIGTDKNTCILKSQDGSYEKPVINGSCGYLENLTLYHEYVEGISKEITNGTSGGYAFHCENEYGVGKTLEFHHCVLKSDFFPALGVGLRKNFHLIVDDCELINNQIMNRGNYSGETDGSLGALYFHESIGDAGDQYITVKNSVLKSNLGYSLCPYTLGKNGNIVYCEFINNVLYDAINGRTNNIWYRNGNPFTNGNFVLVGTSFGNSNTNLNN